MREKPRDKERLLHMIEAINNIEEFSNGINYEEFASDKMRRFAIIKNLEIVGEAAYMTTKEFRELYNEVEWNVIIKFRHVLVHGYYQLSNQIIWNTLKNDLAGLKQQVLNIIDSLN